MNKWLENKATLQTKVQVYILLNQFFTAGPLDWFPHIVFKVSNSKESHVLSLRLEINRLLFSIFFYKILFFNRRLVAVGAIAFNSLFSILRSW